MRRLLQVPTHRRCHRLLKLHQIRSRLGYALLLMSLAYPLKDAFHFNNGSGGADWRVGKPLVSVWDANQSRPKEAKPPLPELRSMAVNLINRDRQLNGLPSLVEDPLLTQSAQRHAEDMKARNYYDHITPEGKNPTDRLAAIGGQGGVGENIMLQTGAIGNGYILNWGLIETFQKSWMYSDGHRANLINPVSTKIGYGIVADLSTGKIYAVQNFQ